MVNGRSPFRLRFFGGASIEGPNGPLTGRAARRHVLALTARLATAPEQTLGREVLMALLWPESDATSARRLLNAAVYDLRKALGASVVRTEGGNLHLDVDVLWPDVVEFDRALEAHALDRAATLYGGPFLHGFHLSEALEFEEWVEQARERYARKQRACLEELAREAEGARDWRAVERWWSRLAAEDPTDAHVIVALMRVLDRAGARGRALERAETYERIMREEFGAEPDPSVVEFARRLRQGPVSPLPEAETPVVASSPAERVLLRRSFPRRSIAAALGLAVLVTILLSRGQGEPPNVSPERIAILPFTVNAEARHAYLGEGIVDLLSNKLNVPGQIHPVDPSALLAFVHERNGSSIDGREVAERFAAAAYVRGAIVQSGSALVIHASLHDLTGRRLGTAEVTIPDEEAILEGLDQLASRLLADRYGEAGDPLTSHAAMATRSLPALKSYLDGERAFRAGRFEEAARAFGRAATADSTFALASYRMSLANLWADRPQTQPFDIDEMALRHSSRLPERSRLLIEAYVAWRRGDADAAERLQQRILAAHPDDVEALHQLGETLFHYNPVRGRSILEAREPFERVLKLQPNHWGALWHLAQLAAFQRRTAELDRILTRLMERDPTPTKSLEIRTLQAFARGDVPAIERLLPELRRADVTVLAPMATKVAVYLRDLGGAARVARLLTEPDRPPRHQALGHEILAYIESARGRPRAAEVHLTALERVDDRRAGALEARSLLSLLPLLARPGDEVGKLRQVVSRWESPAEGVEPLGQEQRYLRLYLLGLLSAALEDSTAAIARAQELERSGEPVRGAWAAAIRAEILRTDRPAEALAVMREGWRPEWFGWAVSSPAASRAHERFARAEMSRQVGHEEEALRWYTSLEEHGLYDLAYLPAANLAKAEIYERLGRPADAAREYARFLALWKNSEPELRPVVEDARRKLARLNGASAQTASARS